MLTAPCILYKDFARAFDFDKIIAARFEIQNNSTMSTANAGRVEP